MPTSYWTPARRALRGCSAAVNSSQACEAPRTSLPRLWPHPVWLQSRRELRRVPAHPHTASPAESCARCLILRIASTRAARARRPSRRVL